MTDPEEAHVHTVALVPARGGSKGLPGKNLATVGGVSLVGRAVRVARHVDEIDEVVVSSDDAGILAEGRAHGARAETRPEGLAGDEVMTLEVVRDFVFRNPDVDALVLLQPTSPLREASDVRRCLEALRSCESTATVTPCEHPPAWSFRLTREGTLDPLLGWRAVSGRRQDAPATYRLNGAVYAVRSRHLREGGSLVGPETHAVIMPAERSVDVDDETGRVFADLLASSGSAPEETT